MHVFFFLDALHLGRQMDSCQTPWKKCDAVIFLKCPVGLESVVTGFTVILDVTVVASTIADYTGVLIIQ